MDEQRRLADPVHEPAEARRVEDVAGDRAIGGDEGAYRPWIAAPAGELLDDRLSRLDRDRLHIDTVHAEGLVDLLAR